MEKEGVIGKLAASLYNSISEEYASMEVDLLLRHNGGRLR
jgi:hypothetical protein